MLNILLYVVTYTERGKRYTLEALIPTTNNNAEDIEAIKVFAIDNHITLDANQELHAEVVTVYKSLYTAINENILHNYTKTLCGYYRNYAGRLEVADFAEMVADCVDNREHAEHYTIADGEGDTIAVLEQYKGVFYTMDELDNMTDEEYAELTA